MSLSRKMAWKVAGLALGLLLVTGVSIWGMLGMRLGVRMASVEFNELRMIWEADRHWSIALGLLEAGATPSALQREVRSTREQVSAFLTLNEEHLRVNPSHEMAEAADAYPLRDDLDELLVLLESGRPGVGLNHDLVGVVSAMLDHLLKEIDTGIALAHEGTSRRLTTTLLLLTALSVLGAIGTALFSIHQYRSVVRPLKHLRDAVQRIAQHQFRDRIQLSGDDEFVHLGSEFNRMADELDALYRSLETQVRQKSSELARSERLASVGFLAAGVAHEINNPLNVISAYAELSLRRIGKTFGREAYDPENVKALEVIRDEAFRCKEISQKLLSLARTAPKTRTPVSLKYCAEEVVTLVSALPGSKDRRILLTLDNPAELMILGNEVELKQVLLNIVVNALEAVQPGVGEVRIHGARNNEWVQLSVADNGAGMDKDTLDHVFEPFFTHRRSDHPAGIGLGLSITHAIVEAHEGTITADSAGPELGSCFTIQFPFASENRADGSPSKQAG